MTIKRFDTVGSIDDEGEVFDARGNSLGRAHLSVNIYQRVHDAGTHEDGDAEVGGDVLRRSGHIRLDEGGVLQLSMAVASQAELTIRLDNGGQIRFRAVSETGKIRITGIGE